MQRPKEIIAAGIDNCRLFWKIGRDGFVEVRRPVTHGGTERTQCRRFSLSIVDYCIRGKWWVLNLVFEAL